MKRPLSLQSSLLLSALILPGLLAGCRMKSEGHRTMTLSAATPMVNAFMMETLPPSAPSNTENYDLIQENTFQKVLAQPVSTFSVDVDTASYSNVRRFLKAQNSLPPRDAVRIEELVNYFSYAYAAPTGGAPFSATATMAACPWAEGHRLVRIGLKARDVDVRQLPRGNYVFLLDVSGSMSSPDKLPLLVSSLKLLVDRLGENDRIAIVVYAGAAGVVLPSTAGDRKSVIMEALDSLSAGGSTAGGAGIQLAYKIAREHFIPGGNNRVILATDGDFNVGVSDDASLVRMVEKQAKSGVFLTVLGFGTGNLKDSRMEQLADKGNGNYAYIDSLQEGRKVLVEQAGGTLLTVAKDVKIQIEFNPAKVQAYRLIGYENRLLAREDFNDDKKDAGEIGAGHQVTALYEVIPPGLPVTGDAPPVTPLKYQQEGVPAEAALSDELMTVRLRYKEPAGAESRLIEFPVADRTLAWTDADTDFRFAASVAAFGMKLRESAFAGTATLEQAASWAASALGPDAGGYRQECVELMVAARKLASR